MSDEVMNNTSSTERKSTEKGDIEMEETKSTLEQVVNHKLLTSSISAYLKKRESLNKVVPAAVKEVKPYKPQEFSLKGLEMINVKLQWHLKYISPLTKAQYTGSKFSPDEVKKLLVPFSDKQIKRMDMATKEEIHSRTMIGLMQTIRDDRGLLLESGCYFEDDYERNKLKLLMEGIEKPTELYSEDDYSILESIFLQSFSNVIKLQLGMATPKEVYLPVLQRNSRYAFLDEIHINALKHFDNFSRRDMNTIKEVYIIRLSSDAEIGSAEIIEYQQLKVCPLKFCFPTELDKIIANDKARVSSQFGFVQLRTYIQLFPKMALLLKQENIDFIINKLAKIQQAVIHRLESGDDLEQIGNDTFIEHLIDINKILTFHKDK